jgi:hypothetical protein
MEIEDEVEAPVSVLLQVGFYVKGCPRRLPLEVDPSELFPSTLLVLSYRLLLLGDGLCVAPFGPGEATASGRFPRSEESLLRFRSWRLRARAQAVTIE